MSVTFTVENDIGVIALDYKDSKVNLLTADVLKLLDATLDKVKATSSLKALLIVSKKKDVFIAGADIKEIERITLPRDGQAKARGGQDVLNKLEDLDVPTVAVIDGVTLGGGCELALACQYRLATFSDKVKIGLPEVNLGFVPGFGGTYRLPRLVGLTEGLKMILGGKPVSGSKALRIGLVDRLVTQVGLEQNIEQFVEDVLKGKIHNVYPRKKKKGLPGFLEGSFTGQALIFYQSRKSVLKLTKGFYPAPLKVIDVIQKTSYMTDRQKCLDIESRTFGELAVTSISKNLVQVFYLSEQYKKLSLDDAKDVKTRAIDKCGVLGAGIMGGGIAQLLSSRGVWVRLKDINYDAIAKGFGAAAKVYKQGVKKRRFTKAVASGMMARISGSLDYSGFGNADMVIEAVVENMELKKKVFKELDEVTPSGAVLASNTSALSIAEMASATKDPSKVIGLHFFNPVHRMPLVEIITTPQTSRETIVTTLRFAKRMGKIPILVKDSCGFIVNRILLGYINEAGHILEECGQLEAIDKAMTDFGMPMGPFTLCDEVGMDVGIKVLHILQGAFGEGFKPVKIFEKVYEKGFLGKKSGQGFYLHKKKRMLNTKIVSLLPQSNDVPFSVEECRDRLIYGMINEAARCLQEGIVDAPSAIDTGMIFGTGFPPFRGGLLRYADSVGINQVVTRLEGLTNKLGVKRFKPAQYLLDLKAQRKKFFQ